MAGGECQFMRDSPEKSHTFSELVVHSMRMSDSSEKVFSSCVVYPNMTISHVNKDSIACINIFRENVEKMENFYEMENN
jgi:hypothetical protein